MVRVSNFVEYLQRFKKYFFEHRMVPSMSMCLDVLWVQSKATVHMFYTQLLEHGYLKKIDNKYTSTAKLTAMPLYESVYAWFPSPATDELKHEINIDEYLLEDPATELLVKVRWDSMTGAGIFHDDIVIINKAKKAQEWDIVIAVVDNEYTLKTLTKVWWRYCLQPANDTYDPIYPDESLEIFWVVTGMFRKYST